MVRLNLFLFQSLALLSSAQVQRRWTNADSATGKTGDLVIEGCEYWINDISKDDTCEAIESYFGITEQQFLSWNPSVPSACILILGWSYCVAGPENPVISGSTTSNTTPTPAGTLTYSGTAAPTQSGITSDCKKYYEVLENDTCNTIQDKFMGFTLQQFYSWNPSISKGCKGLQAGYYVCVSDGSSPASPSATATSSSSDHEPHQTGTPSDCNEWYYVVDGDNCETIVKKYGLTKEGFFKLNPATGSTCSNLWLENYVCVGEGSTSTSSPATTSATSTSSSTAANHEPHQTGIPSNCNKWYYVVDGDNCETVAKKYGMTKEEFYNLNPATGSSCAKLWLENYVCVGVSDSSSSATTTVTTSASSTASGGAPGPTGSGTVANCETYYKAQAGDSCWSIVNEKYTYLTQDILTKWNPSLGSACTLILDQYYCVAIKTAQPMPGTINTCKTWHLAIDGDGCWSIEQKYGITTTQFNKWNPQVGSDCANLWLGYYVCVGV
ncbi:hypothetical protein N7509_004159 [Penicillium cosmopolitanum]|uniref:LysM domain-containing protein n=1 Tax=Penicillium cosmopolitanum TaxID=1131564 RepID=A0A9W9W6T7_9EURO|nr:uncharacterized protein N7509_004159 [Penicillium cosmopolitanum]KAJ5404288.1 hypothetical protein N7509_004159 [Penicillium cosmopolitanum]